MHCVGFDISYCCIIPPYNSIQAQAVQVGFQGEKPRLLSPDDRVKLYYPVKDNSYSEGNKMKYWQVLKDVSGDGTMNDPGDNMANYVWNHLFIYKDLQGRIPENPEGQEIAYREGDPGQHRFRSLGKESRAATGLCRGKRGEYRFYGFPDPGDQKCSPETHLFIPMGCLGSSFDGIQRQPEKRDHPDDHRP